MQKPYTSNYLKIYFWNGLSILMKFISLFIVVPYLTSEPAIYGIYSICVSMGLFLNYADLGFLGASRKYAAEAFAQGNRDEEMKNIGAGIFILLLFSLALTLIFFYFSFFPQIIIKGLNTPLRIQTASSLLFILAAFTPFVVLRRTIEIIFSIRLDDFINRRIFLIGNAVTILSVFYFFGSENYKIVSYYFFLKIIDLFAIIISIGIAKKKYSYDFITFFKYVRFNRKVFLKIKKLAITGFYLTLTWVLFYEFDQIFIGKVMGPKQAAIYAIALTFPVIFRQVFGIFFGPFGARSNHFIGIKDENGLKKFVFQLLIFAAPITILPPIAIALTIKPLILSWVGIKYTESINIGILLALSYSFTFISYITSIVLYSKVRIKEMYIAGSVPVVVFWFGVLLTYNKLGLLSFGIFRLLGMVFIQVFYLVILINYLNISFIIFIKKVIKPIILPVFFLIISLLFLKNILPIEKSKFNLLVVSISIIGSLFLSYTILYFTSKSIRTYFRKNIINVFLKRNNV